MPSYLCILFITCQRRFLLHIIPKETSLGQVERFIFPSWCIILITWLFQTGFASPYHILYLSIVLSCYDSFADYVVVPYVRYLVTFPMSIPLPIASQLPCSGLTAFNAVDEGVEFVKSTMEIKGSLIVNPMVIINFAQFM